MAGCALPSSAALLLASIASAEAQTAQEAQTAYIDCVVAKAVEYSRLQSPLNEVVDVAFAACSEQKKAWREEAAKVFSKPEPLVALIDIITERTRGQALVAAADERLRD